MQAVGPMASGFPPVQMQGSMWDFVRERYSDDEVVSGAGSRTLAVQLTRKENVAPPWRVVHVPAKEAYMFLAPQPHGMPQTWGHAGRDADWRAVRRSDKVPPQRRIGVAGSSGF